MDLFKERLKIAWGHVVAWVLFFFLPATLFILTLWVVSLFESLSDFLGWLLLFVIGLILLGGIIHGIYWLFVEPFRKTKEDK